jgi:hypothetical protein
MARRLFSSSFQRPLCIVVTILCFAGMALPGWAQFETRATSPMPSGAYSMATGDFNNDGKLDIVVVTDDGFAVALGNGDGTFQPAVSYSDTSSAAVAVADFNNDGNLDIVVANYESANVSVYLGNARPITPYTQSTCAAARRVFPPWNCWGNRLGTRRSQWRRSAWTADFAGCGTAMQTSRWSDR